LNTVLNQQQRRTAKKLQRSRSQLHPSTLGARQASACTRAPRPGRGKPKRRWVWTALVRFRAVACCYLRLARGCGWLLRVQRFASGCDKPDVVTRVKPVDESRRAPCCWMTSITKNAPLLTALLAFSLAQCGKVVTHRRVVSAVVEGNVSRALRC
jgi:hypothetical protein